MSLLDALEDDTEITKERAIKNGEELIESNLFRIWCVPIIFSQTVDCVCQGLQVTNTQPPEMMSFYFLKN